MNILATADLHLGRQSSNLPKGLPESSVAFTLNRLVNLAIDETVDALLISGDMIDRDNRYYEAVGQVQRAFERLGEAGIPVVMVSGNHDYDVLPDIVKNREYEHVHLLGEKGRWESKIIETRGGELQLVGWSFPAQHVMDDPLIQLRTDELALNPNLTTIGLLHGDLYDQKSQYAPLDMSGFSNRQIQAWVIGHIHKPEILQNTNPLVFYPGSPQALSSKEPGSHGAVLLSIDGDRISHTAVPISPVQYETIQMDVSDISNQSDFRNHLSSVMETFVQHHLAELENVQYLVYDVEMTGEHSNLKALDEWSALADELEQQMASEITVSVRKVINLAEPAVGNLQELAQQPTPPGLLARLIVELESGDESEILNTLLSKQTREISRINRSSTYRPLGRFENQIPESEESSRELLLKESRRLLGELLSQKETSDE